MTTKDVRERSRIELNAKSDGAYDIFVNEELDEFVSFGIRQFYARRLNGFTSDRTSFEQGQKRSDDLRCIYTKEEISSFENGIKNGISWSSFKIPDNYQHMLSEDVKVISTTGISPVIITEIGVFDVVECTTENLTARLNDSLGSHILYMDRLRPLRLYTFEQAMIPDPNEDPIDPDILIPDPTKKMDMYSVVYYKAPIGISIDKYIIEYIRKPNEFGIYSDGYDESSFNEDDEINQVPDYAWDEVLSIALKHALENTSSYRVQTYSQESALVQ